MMQRENNSSIFNDDQKAYAKYLNTLPDSQRCWCGWYKFGECPFCRFSLTLHDRKKVECKKCGSYPDIPGSITIHRIGCSKLEK